MSYAQQRTRRREQRENTRREILEAADRLLRERPYRELSVDLVMAQTGLTRTAFYRHFDDVPDLVLRLLAEVGQDLYAVAERWRESAADDFIAAAREGLNGTVAFMVKHGRLVRAVADGAATDEMIERGYRQFVDFFAEMIGGYLAQLAERGELEARDPHALARALNLMNEAFLLDQFGQEPTGDPDVALATLETIWLRVIPRGGGAAP
jgi:AcrR family transcriptional regulator